MKQRSTIAGIVAFTLVMQTAFVAHAEETVDVATEAAPAEEPTPSPYSFLTRPAEVDITGQLALTNASSALRGSSLLGPSPSPIMSSNTKTVIIVAIIAGAVLILAGVIAIGKPFKHL